MLKLKSQCYEHKCPQFAPQLKQIEASGKLIWRNQTNLKLRIRFGGNIRQNLLLNVKETGGKKNNNKEHNSKNIKQDNRAQFKHMQLLTSLF